MKTLKCLLLLALACFVIGSVWADDSSLLVVNKVRYMPLKGHEKDVIGATIFGSNVSPDDGFVELAQIKDLPPAGQDYGELTFDNKTAYRWLKYLAAPGAYGRIAKLEFCTFDVRLKPIEFYSNHERGAWREAFQYRPGTYHQSDLPDNQYVVVDIGEEATGRAPSFSPGQSESPTPIKVAIQARVPGAVIRYTLDGTAPTLENSKVYTEPITVDKTETIEASAYVDGRAPTPPGWSMYIIGPVNHMNTFHVGNSLTGITGRFDFQAHAAGALHHSDRYLLGGGLSKALWNCAFLPIGDPADKDKWIDLYSTRVGQTINYSLTEIQNTTTQWNKLWPAVTKIENFTLQPRDFDIAEEADYDNRWISLVAQKAPNVQPWLYVEWTERDRHRPTDLGKEPTSEMQTVYPAVTWEESMGAMNLYGEDLLSKVNETYKGAKPVHIIPASLALGWIHHIVEQGQMPGYSKDDFYNRLFEDSVHLNPDGAFLVDAMFYSAFYGESPVGKFLPVLTGLTGPQALLLQKLAWDTMTNYPYSGLYQEGKTPVRKPQFSPAAAPIKEITPVTLTSATPGAWFRYTLDGTTPTRTKGYVYCGVISARPGMTIKAMAYKSGMADSPVSQINYATAP